ncbi:MAG: flavodoxin family protein [Planctomycetota bacterium]
MNTLVIYYSRTGNTRLVARFAATQLQATEEEIVDQKNRDGVRGFVGGAWDALLRRRTEIEPAEQDPADYELVLVGTPVWAGTMCPAVRRWLTVNSDSLHDVAFFLTTGGSGRQRTFQEMAQVSGATPHATLDITVAEIKNEQWRVPTEEFCEELTAWYQNKRK